MIQEKIPWYLCIYCTVHTKHDLNCTTVCYMALISYQMVRDVSSEPGNLNYKYPTQHTGIYSLSWAYRYCTCTPNLLQTTHFLLYTQLPRIARVGESATADKNSSANQSLCIQSRVNAQLYCITGTL